MSEQHENEPAGAAHGTPADPPPSEEELDIEGPNESAPGHNPDETGDGEDPPPAA